MIDEEHFSREKMGPDDNANHRRMWSERQYRIKRREGIGQTFSLWTKMLGIASTISATYVAIQTYLHGLGK